MTKLDSVCVCNGCGPRYKRWISLSTRITGSSMPHLNRHDVMTMFMALATLLGCAKLAAELMQKIGQPPVLGEISVGIFLGPKDCCAWTRNGSACWPATGGTSWLCPIRV